MSETQTENRHGEAPGKNKNRIDVTVRHAGLRVTLEFNVHQHIRKVLDDALEAFAQQFNLRPPANSTAVLRFGDRDLTNLDQSIEDAGIRDGAELDLRFEARSG